MFKILKKFIKKYVTLYGITVLIGIIATLCLVYWGESFLNVGKSFFERNNFKFYLILVFAVCWLFVYTIYLHKQLVNFIKFVLQENKLMKSDMQKLNKNTRNLITQHISSNNENEVA